MLNVYFFFKFDLKSKLHTKLLDTTNSIVKILNEINGPEMRDQSDFLIFKIVFTISALTNDVDLKASVRF